MTETLATASPGAGSSRTVQRLRVRHGVIEAGSRAVPEETAVSITYGRASCAVMMATPVDLEDFALGFSLTEGIVERAEQVTELEIVPQANGIEARMWLAPERQDAFLERRRFMAGPGGCGLCGIESLDAACPVLPRVPLGGPVTPEMIATAVASLGPAQTLNHLTRAVHGAGFWSAREGLVALREDAGRHNALDKLAGALAKRRIDPATGIVVLTSRLSIELVQKAARLGVPLLAAVSAPTAAAIRIAEAAGITLVAIARDDGFEIFTHSERLLGEAGSHVA